MVQENPFLLIDKSLRRLYQLIEVNILFWLLQKEQNGALLTKNKMSDI